MRTLLALIRAYPARTAIMLVALSVAGVAEGLSLTTLLPLMSVAVGGTAESGFGQTLVSALAQVGLEPTIGVMLLIIVGGMVLKSILLLLANRQVGYTVAHVATSLRLELIEALLASRWEYFLRQHTGALANSIATEAYRAATGFQYGASVIALAIQVLVYSVVALLVSWQATLVSLVIGMFFLFALHQLVRASRRAGARQTRLMRALLTYLTDVLGSVKPLKAMGRDNVAETVMHDQNRQLESAMKREVMSKETLRALQEPMVTALAASGLFLALVYWKMSLAEVMVLVFLLVRILTLLNKMQRQFQHQTAQDSAYWSLRAAAAEARRAVEQYAGTAAPSLEQGIRMSNVWFAYGGKSVFRGLDMNIPAGSFTAVVGESGIGKSTFLDLICGLARVETGQILVDGMAIEDLDLKRWRRLIGYVPQENILLHDTICTNVLVGERDLTRADAERALRQSGAWDFVTALPDGMDSIVGERGGMISGGQRQRIALARALAHGPKLLILDEPTSALDPESERTICATLSELAGKLTIIAVSHQPAIAAVADRIYAFDGGLARLVKEPGTSNLT
ncbi:MAG: ABC transporter ATP-binding protein [Gammaproteobacteria bacterium RIFCSPLOWO2_02_FULL_61_13]|nr:MAG: ABC transporter ATP-binding protein [Gammaproteobacteria bacterium RIFCSPLOWO2_02_FULL_61_13]